MSDVLIIFAHFMVVLNKLYRWKDWPGHVLSKFSNIMMYHKKALLREHLL